VKYSQNRRNNMSKLNMNWFNELLENGDNVLETYCQLYVFFNTEVIYSTESTKNLLIDTELSLFLIRLARLNLLFG
jgi:hypothetical protein